MRKLTRLKQGPGAAPHHLWQMAGRTWWRALLGLGGGLPVTGGINIRSAHWLPGKPAEGQAAPHCPFDKLSEWRCSDLELGQSLAGAWGKDVRTSDR